MGIVLALAFIYIWKGDRKRVTLGELIGHRWPTEQESGFKEINK